MRVVADTNILISALRFGGRPAAFLSLARDGVFVLLVSEPILTEAGGVLSHKFGLFPEDVFIALSGIRATAELTTPQLTLRACEDPDDDRILEAAVEGNADCIVTGDRHLLRMGTFCGVEIVTVSDFLARQQPSDA